MKIKHRVLAKKGLFYPPIQMDDLYNEKDNIDIVFLGSSRCDQGFDPAIIDSITGMNSFNLGSGSQTPTTSYFLLKEFLRFNNPKYIIYEVSVDVMNTMQLVNGGFMLDAMKNSNVKLNFYLNGFEFAEQIELLLPLYRFRNNRGFFYYSIFEDIDEHYNNGRRYVDKGFVINENNFREPKTYTFEITEVTLEHLEYLDKINQTAAENDIELIFVSLPYPSTTEITNQEYFSEYMENLIANDFNRLYLDYLGRDNIFNDSHFADENHLNKEGVKLASALLGNAVRN